MTYLALQQSSLLDVGSSAYLEVLYDHYLNDPASVPTEWRNYFEQLPVISPGQVEERHLQIQAEFRKLAREPHYFGLPEKEADTGGENHKQAKVYQLIESYRLLGHLEADIDPLKSRKKFLVPELMLSYYRLTAEDLKTPFKVGSLPGVAVRPLQEIIDLLRQLYCGTIASEFTHIPDSPERIWVQTQIEGFFVTNNLSNETKMRVFKTIVAAEGLEKYLGAKYPGAKRFSLEGTDSLMVALDTLIQQGGAKGAKEMVICMSHRGRLNVLVNLLGKKPNQLFDEFEGKHYDESLESGDVKYHQGFSTDIATPGGDLHLSLAYNPSHLEIVTPVMCGAVKARQERRSDTNHTQVLSIALHGDAAFAGQGVVMETLNMAQTRGFKIGGTVHLIVNNQIGFTTSNEEDARSTLYCSDIGKMMEVPILHVNADDPEAVFKVMKFALEYREKFKKDVIVDLVGYRRQGHNEADEPAATQPLMYQLIRRLPTVCKLYSDKLVTDKCLSAAEAEKIVKDYRESLEARQQGVALDVVTDTQRGFAADWKPYQGNDWRTPASLDLSLATLQALALKQTELPGKFSLHPRVEKIVEDRRKMARGELPMDWGFGETLAYAVLLQKNYRVRLSGQDVGRGTFFHRHVVLYNQETGEEYIPLAHLSENKTEFSVVCSLLSEEAVLGFEYGYATVEPEGLIIWEAQFGDFANNAQVVIDQFISSGEQKWGRLNGLTLFLPHGYEGQGAEHSSARLERYLQLCAQHNLQVCVPTTPAQVFHMICRQMIRSLRKPLIVLTPKSLLRHKLAVSSLTDLEKNSFLPVISEIDKITAASVRKIVLCTGKIYYELLEKRRLDNQLDVVIIRIEQLYPFPDVELKAVLSQYPNETQITWCQEEPQNQGAWTFIQPYIQRCLSGKQMLNYMGREPAAAPAVGYLHLHQTQQSTLVKDALS